MYNKYVSKISIKEKGKYLLKEGFTYEGFYLTLKSNINILQWTPKGLKWSGDDYNEKLNKPPHKSNKNESKLDKLMTYIVKCDDGSFRVYSSKSFYSLEEWRDIKFKDLIK
jgi:hypothetical protein